MTEKEAWLELAEMFDSAEPTWNYFASTKSVTGICDALLVSYQKNEISSEEKRKMIERLGEYFNPNGRNINWDFFWPNNCLRASRILRATACGFLAAMCDD